METYMSESFLGCLTPRQKSLGPAEAVDFRKQKRICYTFNYYRMQRRLAENTAVRFDVIEVDKDFRCHWIQNAFEFQG